MVTGLLPHLLYGSATLTIDYAPELLLKNLSKLPGPKLAICGQCLDLVLNSCSAVVCSVAQWCPQALLHYDLVHSRDECQKPAKIQFKKIVKLTHHTYTCNSLTNVECKTHAKKRKGM